jgi:hypothetical protein
MARRSKPVFLRRIHGDAAFARLCSMFRDPALSYQDIARQFRISRQRVGQIAKTARVNEVIASGSVRCALHASTTVDATRMR